jgi:hypothetical protein
MVGQIDLAKQFIQQLTCYRNITCIGGHSLLQDKEQDIGGLDKRNKRCDECSR